MVHPNILKEWQLSLDIKHILSYKSFSKALQFLKYIWQTNLLNKTNSFAKYSHSPSQVPLRKSIRFLHCKPLSIESKVSKHRVQKSQLVFKVLSGNNNWAYHYQKALNFRQFNHLHIQIIFGFISSNIDD